MNKNVQRLSFDCTLSKNQHSYINTDVSEKEYYFSDLVPFCVTVEDVTDRCCWSKYQQLNPMTACKKFYEAVYSPMEKPFSDLLAGTEGSSGAYPKSAPTVTI